MNLEVVVRMVEQSLFDIESIVQDVVYLYDLLPTDEAESLVHTEPVWSAHVAIY